MSSNTKAGQKGFTTLHGGTTANSKSPTYQSWSAMLARCNNPKSTAYLYYGARGIKVCDRWSDFANFLVDMGERPEGMTLDRYPNNSGNYEPGNCRWASKKEQAKNRRVRTNFKSIDITGQRFGRLTAVNVHAHTTESRKGVEWYCSCDCGGSKIVACGQLRSGTVASCGCAPTGRKPRD